MKTRTRTLAALAVLPFALAACGGNDDAKDASAPETSSSPSVSPTPIAMTNTNHWAGELNGVKADVNTAADAPAAVQDAWTTLGQKTKKVLAAQIDNRGGSTSADLTGAEFITESGDTITYDLLSTTLETSDAGLDATSTNQVIDVHNEYAGDDYEVAAGAKKTLLLVANQDLPEKITHATLNTRAGDISLTPTKDGAAPTAPEPSVSAPQQAEEAPAPAAPTEDVAPTTEPTPQQTYDNPDPYGTADGTDGTQATSRAEENADTYSEPNSNQDVNPEEEKAICRAADPNTATSGLRQFCYTVYGISI